MNGKTNSRGFTLIELLIVVAIIAILAAIALPNFLQAQARSRVSRTMSDMRNVSMSMQRYKLDTGDWLTFDGNFSICWMMRTPGGGAVGTGPSVPNTPDGCFIPNSNGEYLGKFITTPVAYMSSVPLDYFNSNIPAGFDFYCGAGQQCSYVITHSAMDLVNRQFGPHTYQYFMESAGPDAMWWTEPLAGGRQSDKFHYDPTNGALSQGQIVLTNLGFITPDVSGLPYYPIG